MQNYALGIISPRNWPVVWNDRLRQRTRGYGRNSRRTWSIVGPRSPRNALRAWTSLPRTVLPPSSIPDARDYTFQCDSRVSVGTLDGRISIPYQGYDKHIARIRQGATIGDAKLWYDRQKKQFYVLVSLSIDVSEPTCEQFTEVVGVDAGIRYLAVTSTSTGKAGFHSGKRTRHQANHYARLRKRLQHKGTRGAKRRLRRIEQRERRLKAQANHCIAIQIVKQHPHALIGLEHLSDIRERTKRRKHKRKKNGKAARLQRYAELRWSPDVNTSLRSETGGS